MQFALVKTTLLDYPGRVAASVFLPGCHLRCPYCHNPDFVDLSIDNAAGALNEDIEGFRRFLSRRARHLGGIVFSGGEALLHPLLPTLFDMAEEYELPIKLDTAGLLPDLLTSYLENKRLSYVSVDLKTLPERYGEIGWKGSGEKSAEVLLARTISLLAESGIPWELRTTVVPPLVDEKILGELSETAAKAPRWVWQPYRRGHTLDPEWSSLAAPDGGELLEMSKRIDSESEIVIR